MWWPRSVAVVAFSIKRSAGIETPHLRNRTLTKLYTNFTKFSRFLVNRTILLPLNKLPTRIQGGIQPSLVMALDYESAVIADPFVTPSAE